MNWRLTILLLLALLAGPAQAHELAVRVQSATVHDEIPSGSGMTWHGGRHFVVGDDSSTLFTLDRRFRITDRTPLQRAESAGGRIAKLLKPDYEAMALVTWEGSVWNLILGSGSLKGSRETGLMVNVDGKHAPHVRDMAALYRDFAAPAGFDAGAIVNIEAVAVGGDKAYLFNRGNAGRNLLFKVALADLLAYMTGKAERIADIRLHEARLPRLNGREAGFSGADYWPEIDSLVYSASVEDTDSAFDDGAVLGSYLGLIPVAGLTDGAALDLRQSARLLRRNGAPLKTKVESVALTHTEAQRATASLVSDNDDGHSTFFDVVLTVTAAKRR